MEVCALIPVFNEAPYVERVVRGCLRHVRAVFVVDDGSTDGSGQVARKAGAIVLTHPVNRGKGAALKTGFAAVLDERTWDAIVILDGDGQHDWNEIPRFVSCLTVGDYDIVLGDRMGDVRAMPLRRKVTNWLTSRILSALTSRKITDSQCGFRLLKTELLRGIVLKTTKFDTESEILLEAARKGVRIGTVSVATIYGSETSYVHPVPDTLRFVRVGLKYVFWRRARPKKEAPKRNNEC